MRPPSCPRTLIINILRKHPDGLTLTSIAELTGLHRHTATKYIYELKGAGIINERDVGSAKLCYLKDGLKKEEERKVIKRLNGSSWKGRMKASRDAFHLKSSAGQAQILAVFFFLFMIPASVIIAQNATQNITQEGNLIIEAIAGMQAGNETNSESDSEQTPIENLSTIAPEENASIANETFAESIADSSANETSQPAENDSQPELQNEIQVNETILPEQGIFGNETISSPNMPEPAKENPAKQPGPVLEVRISAPEKITRGETIGISAIVLNSGGSEARNVRLFWEIPSGFEIASGAESSDCDTLPPNSECMSGLALSSSIATETGKSEFKVKVKYEE